MPTSYQVVLRVEAIKTEYALKGVEKHEARADASIKESHDPSRKHLNTVLHGANGVYEDTMAVVSQYKKAHPKSAIAAEMILTANAEWFDQISPNWRKGEYSKAFIEWRDLTLKWLKSTYPGLAHASIHMDERAPHIHAIVVPVATKTIAYRRGQKEVTRIRYNELFGDDMQTIVAARKAGNSELTKLGRLQTAYAAAMKPVGLVRGIANKYASHQTISEYQTALAAPSPSFARPKPVPERSLQDRTASTLGLRTDNLRLIDQVTAYNAQIKRANKAAVKALQAKAKDYDRLQSEVSTLKESLIMKDKQLAEQGAALRTLETYKLDVQRLRGLPIEEVAERIGATPTKADRNAIDLLKNHAGFTYDEAVAWLYNEYDKHTAHAEAAKLAVGNARSITDVKPEQPLSPFDLKTAEQVRHQLSALDASRYRLTLQVADPSNTPDLRTYNYGKNKGPNGDEVFYDADSITRVIPFLRRENVRGYNVYITPYHDDKLYLLVDDLTNETLPRFHAEGYRPNVLQTTSPHKMQAVFALPSSEVSEAARNALFNELNGLYGDKNITGYTHPFRLAGFTNAKPKHRSPDGRRPFVRVLHTATSVCSKAIEWCRTFMQATSLPRMTRKQRTEEELFLHKELIANLRLDAGPPGEQASAEAIQFYSWIAQRYPVDTDYSRADNMLVRRMTGRYTDSEIASVILAHSPGITDRHRDVMRYLRETLVSGTRPK